MCTILLLQRTEGYFWGTFLWYIIWHWSAWSWQHESLHFAISPSYLHHLITMITPHCNRAYIQAYNSTPGQKQSTPQIELLHIWCQTECCCIKQPDLLIIVFNVAIIRNFLFQNEQERILTDVYIYWRGRSMSRMVIVIEQIYPNMGSGKTFHNICMIETNRGHSATWQNCFSMFLTKEEFGCINITLPFNLLNLWYDILIYQLFFCCSGNTSFDALAST